MTSPRRAIVLVVSLAVLIPSTSVDGARQTTDERLARSSRAAVHGQVVSIAAAWDDAVGAVYTYVTLDVVRAWGAASGASSRVVVKQLGGVVGDTALVIGGQARFAVGEDVLLFLEVRPRDRTLAVSGLEAGKWTLEPSSRGPVARRTRQAMRGELASETRALADLERLAALTGRDASATRDVVLDGRRASAGGAQADLGAPSFTYLTPATPARWHEADWGAPVFVDAQAGGHPLFPGGGIAEIVRAAGRWSAAAALQLAPGTFRDRRCLNDAGPADGRISIAFDDPCGEIDDASPTLALGGAYYTSADVRRVGDVEFWKITKGIVVTDNVLAKFAGLSTGCWDELMTHELGHAIGLGHAAARPSVMYPELSADCASRTESLPLADDDRAGVTALYPLAASRGGAPGPPVALSGVVSGDDVTLQWRPSLSGGAPTTYHVLAGTLPGATDVGGAVVSGTSLFVPHVTPGVYYVRAIAANAAGASAPSAEVTLIVGSGLPGTPTGLLAAAGSGGSVIVHWDPPASGLVPDGYRLVARDPAGAVYRLPMTGTSFRAQGVASGTYFVRVAAVTAAGAGPVTAEIAVVVP